MKPFVFLLVAAALLGAARAQEAPPEEPASVPTTLFPPGTPVSRTPAPPEIVRRKPRGGKKSQYATEAAVNQANADPLEVRVAYRKAKTLAMDRDPRLPDLLREAESEPTDDLKRAKLKEYYTLLYNSVRKIDRSPAMKAHVELLSKASAQRYDPKRGAISGEDDLVGRNGRGRR